MTYVVIRNERMNFYLFTFWHEMNYITNKFTAGAAMGIHSGSETDGKLSSSKLE